MADQYGARVSVPNDLIKAASALDDFGWAGLIYGILKFRLWPNDLNAWTYSAPDSKTYWAVTTDNPLASPYLQPMEKDECPPLVAEYDKDTTNLVYLVKPRQIATIKTSDICTCGGPQVIIKINFEDVAVCKTCNKEK